MGPFVLCRMPALLPHLSQLIPYFTFPVPRSGLCDNGVLKSAQTGRHVELLTAYMPLLPVLPRARQPAILPPPLPPKSLALPRLHTCKGSGRTAFSFGLPARDSLSESLKVGTRRMAPDPRKKIRSSFKHHSSHKLSPPKLSPNYSPYMSTLPDTSCLVPFSGFWHLSVLSG